MTKIPTEKSKRMFFFEEEDIKDMDHYVLCSCEKCDTVEHVNCGPKADAAAVVFAINSEGWRFYDEFPATFVGEVIFICRDCVKEITGKYPNDERILLQEYLNETIIGFTIKDNDRNFEEARIEMGLPPNEEYIDTDECCGGVDDRELEDDVFDDMRRCGYLGSDGW